MTDARVQTIEALPKQIDFLQSQAREILYSGAFGAGKTRALCLRTVIRACIPGARELLCRKEMVSLKKTTLKTLLEPDGDGLPPVLPPGTYTYKRQDQEIHIHGGGQIALGGLDSPSKIGSMQLTGVAIDEAVEVEEPDWIMLLGRIRVKVTDLPNQIYAVTNPGAPSHFLAKRFGCVDPSTAEPDTEVIHTHSSENTFLPADYLESLERMQGVAKARYVEGRWVAAEGLVYPGFPDCIVEHQEPPEGRHVGGIDFGWRNPFAALAGTIYEGEDGRDNLFVHWEQYKSETPIEVHAEAIQAQYPDNECTWFCDTEAPDSIRALRKAGLMTRRATKHVLPGIDAVNGLIAGERLWVSAACENLIREAQTYCYDQKHTQKEQPVKDLDHALDALRYMVMGIKNLRMFDAGHHWDAGEGDS